MDLLWQALGISVIVGFVFYVLAGHWGRVLHQQARAISRLSERIEMLEQVDDPHFRERLNESAPAPLEQVITFSLRFADQFWQQTLCLSDTNREFVREFGSFVGSIKLERWRSHILATVTEILPNRKTAAWQTRSLYYYPAAAAQGEPLTLWDLPLARPRPGMRPPSLGLLIRSEALELVESNRYAPLNGDSTALERLLMTIPLKSAALAPYWGHDPAEPDALAFNGRGDWRSYYSDENGVLGLEWQLRLVDLNRKIEWERWKILESTAARVASASS